MLRPSVALSVCLNNSHRPRKCQILLCSVWVKLFLFSLIFFAPWRWQIYNVTETYFASYRESQETSFCPIRTFHLSKNESHILIQHNKTNNFRGLSMGQRNVFFGTPDTYIASHKHGSNIDIILLYYIGYAVWLELQYWVTAWKSNFSIPSHHCLSAWFLFRPSGLLVFEVAFGN